MFEDNEHAKENATEVPEGPSSSTGIRKRRRREDTTFQCPQCHRAFGRVEHLRRHANTHGEARSFKCLLCGKGFNRLDTLQRHELIHQKDPGVSRLKGARACRECANSKARCNGTMPCERCSSKNVDCVYPSAASPAQALDSPSSGISDLASTPAASETVPSSFLESASFPQELDQSLPYIDHAVPFSDQHAQYLSDTWAPRSNPEATDIAHGEHSVLGHGVSSHGANTQQFAFSPFEGSYAGTEASLELHDSSPAPRDRHASMDQFTRRPRLLPNSRSKTAIIDSDSPSSQLSITNIRETALHNQLDRRRLFSRTFAPSTTYLHRRRRFNFPLSGDVLPAFQDHAYVAFDLLSEQTYLSIRESFLSVCTGFTAFQPAYGSNSFPSRRTLNAFAKLYFERFHSVMPILHHPTLRLDESHWILGLAVVTIGSHMSDFEQSEDFSLCLDEFLRRAISTSNHYEAIDRTTLCQAKLLACINQVYSGEETWQESAYNEFASDLVAFCGNQWQRCGTEPPINVPTGQEADSWKHWLQVESCRRTGYAIWMLDTMWAYQFQVQPRLALGHGEVPLPCQEVLWEARTAEQWHHVYQFSPSNLTLLSALQSLQDHKTIQHTMGEFSRIILIHGFYHRSWEMETAEAWSQSRLHQVSMHAPWTDSVCDSLEMLQWSASDVVNAASGMEHPTVLHIHLARIILFAPFQNICDLAYGMTKEDTSIGTSQMTDLRARIRRWVTEDESKARLATLHAGVLFRHLQHFHTGAFYEPSVALLATLTLWAYGAFTNTSSDSRPSLQRRHSDTQEHPTSITLDQQLDPELARRFVREGRNMAPALTGVGSIWAAGGNRRVLLEGSKLVSEIGRWGSGRKVMRILNNLSLCRSI